MATSINEKVLEVSDWSGGIQRKSSDFQRAVNEVDMAVNASFARIGGVEKTKGYTRLGNTITSTSSSSSSTTSTSTSTSSTTTGV